MCRRDAFVNESVILFTYSRDFLSFFFHKRSNSSSSINGEISADASHSRCQIKTLYASGIRVLNAPGQWRPARGSYGHPPDLWLSTRRGLFFFFLTNRPTCGLKLLPVYENLEVEVNFTS